MELSKKKSNFVDAYISSPSIQAAADKCKVSRQTARRWLSEDDVRDAVVMRQKELSERNLRQCERVLESANRELLAILDGDGVLPRDKLKAIEIALESAFHGKELLAVLENADLLRRAQNW